MLAFSTHTYTHTFSHTKLKTVRNNLRVLKPKLSSNTWPYIHLYLKDIEKC